LNLSAERLIDQLVFPRIGIDVVDGEDVFFARLEFSRVDQ
jgi:hypothetical protein